MIQLVKECGKGRENMSKVEDFIAATKLNELVNKKEEDKHGKTVLWALAIVGTVAAIAAIAFGIYKYLSREDDVDDFEDDFEDDFDDDFEDEEDDFVKEDEAAPAKDEE